MPSEASTPAEALVRTLEPVLGEPVEIEGLQRLSGGASRETWAFRAGGRDLILRRDPPGRPGAPGSMALEAGAMRACRRAGLPVPEVIVDDAGSSLGTAGLVMARVPGETLARRILRDDQFAGARQVLAEQLGRFLAGLHAIDPVEVPGLTEADSLAQYWQAYELVADVSPTFEAAYGWLEAHRPAAAGKVVVHGDLRMGNVIVGEEGLRAAIDWELVHLGDPVEDLGWLCVKAWRFGAPLPVGGVGTLEQLLDAYEDESGTEVDRDAFHWWLVQKTLQWGIGCMGQAAAHLSGAVRSVELAAIGRRVAEQEWDLVELLAPEAWAAARATTGGPGQSLGDSGPEPAETGEAGGPDAGLYGRPTAAELLDATRGFLTDTVMGATLGHVSFHARVSANVLGIVERQLLLGPAQEARFAEGLRRLGAASAPELCHAIRRGDFDDRQGELWPFLTATVRDRLAVANPKHLTRP
jgi:aminoglycoside phosphotransferase (APT) family kinase protein